MYIIRAYCICVSEIFILFQSQNNVSKDYRMLINDNEGVMTRICFFFHSYHEKIENPRVRV